VNYTYLKDHKEHPDAQVTPALLREYDMTNFDYQYMRKIVVQRVVERGWPEDWWAIMNTYGEDGVKSAIKEIAYFNDKDMSFVSRVFHIPLSEMLRTAAIR